MIVQISTSLGRGDDQDRWLQIALFAQDSRIDKNFTHAAWVWYPLRDGWRWIGDLL